MVLATSGLASRAAAHRLVANVQHACLRAGRLRAAPRSVPIVDSVAGRVLDHAVPVAPLRRVIAGASRASPSRPMSTYSLHRIQLAGAGQHPSPVRRPHCAVHSGVSPGAAVRSSQIGVGVVADRRSGTGRKSSPLSAMLMLARVIVISPVPAPARSVQSRCQVVSPRLAVLVRPALDLGR